ncbi:hypothetical protein G6F57_001267 [Rhizopus arrhizus]|uniref:Uncharacterized protein n=3 Tax=Rhizopus TaxID=4842 RepID=I1BXE1_RHIO9|nr:hypothetical protein RO3G_05576 [Rhizopus delemar RA 99-880]KAG0737016.1 hypothetical protein G6F23_010601 [Rhizopus arrhizus]KAG1052114.1 hypothetical protein G6F43_005729 [Rhizopus delemar]KAG0769292.1 hypothetical protein G6F24_001209 [Rhizopus arrhizus]KAG0786784.1 hypothetical protein G6F22_007524 [Rhizopus arrhizus]|eukprot:EIE80871.1 hypothetical protein RO3G_05576 [Rhizopus delemar RA 99-880]
MSESIKELLESILVQEEKCQFTSFTSQNALDLGLMLIENAKPFKKPVVIDITLNGHQLFHYAMQGTNKDNDEWVRRKNNVVTRFGHASYYVGRNLANQGKSLEEKYYISEKDYATHGGAFPLIIKNVGVVGTITVSGLAQQDDHNLVANTIQEFLALQQKQQ